MKILSFIKIKPDNEKGMTLVEVIMAVAIFSIVLPLVSVFLMKITTGFAMYDMRSELRRVNQQTNNRIYLRLTACKRIFETATGGAAYLGKLTLTGCPAVITGSVLPVIQETGSMVLGDPDFVASSVGNSLFFAVNDVTPILTGIVDSHAVSGTVRIDTYRFYYYYLTQIAAKSIDGKISPKLTEWQSGLYADYNQISNISDATKKANTINALIAQGITYAWDTTQTGISTTFYSLSGGAATLVASHSIVKAGYTNLTSMVNGSMGSNYSYGYSPNSSGLTSPPKKVPIYATENGLFPGGFEVMITKQSAGRMVLIRTVLVSKESTHSTVGDELTNVTCTRDLW
jgi:prepilin-type N-terminal cleavage/methylation domain-containing protein